VNDEAKCGHLFDCALHTTLRHAKDRLSHARGCQVVGNARVRLQTDQTISQRTQEIKSEYRSGTEQGVNEQTIDGEGTAARV
jgi:hypothetical protein